MPLRDHFHAPWAEHDHWESFHDAWINTLVRQLNGTLLPRQYRALPQVHLGVQVVPDVSAWEQSGRSRGPVEPQGAVLTKAWDPPEPVQTLAITFPDQDLFELRIYDETRGSRLVGVVELVSPANKDRPENRQAFVVKCAGYLQERVGLVVVDVVTTRRANLHQELQHFLASGPGASGASDLYAVAYRHHPRQGSNGHADLETWPVPLDIGRPLPTLPLWLTDGPAIPIDLEASYQETCAVLRMD